LELLYLHNYNNQLSGAIPSLSALTNLTSLYLSPGNTQLCLDSNTTYSPVVGAAASGFAACSVPAATVTNAQVNPVAVYPGNTQTVSWQSSNQAWYFFYLFDTNNQPVNTGAFLAADCQSAGSNGSDGCLGQTNPSTATSDSWVIPAQLAAGSYKIKVAVWNSAGQAVGAYSPIFTVSMYSVTTTRNGTGSGIVSVSGDGYFAAGATVNLTATPDANSTFAGWSSPPCAASFSMPSSNLTCTATFNSATYTLTTSVNGSGSVASNLLGINCGADCTENYPANTVVALTATPLNGSVFAGWGVDCISGATNPLNVTMNKAIHCKAVFITHYGLSVTVNGFGTVVSSSPSVGINCGTDCGETYISETSVILTAIPQSPATFGSWERCDSVNGTQCTVNMTAAKTVTANFNSASYRLTTSVNGSGSIISTLPGINCGTDCIEDYPPTTVVVLTATPLNGGTFMGWDGDCLGIPNNPANIPMNKAMTCQANFSPSHLLKVNITGSGTVTSNPAGINCGNGATDCEKNYLEGTSVDLSAKALSPATFGSWTGCDSVIGTRCTVNMNAAKTPKVTFNSGQPGLTVTKSGTGTGTVTGAGINCGSDCNEAYNYSGTVILTAIPDATSTFIVWTNCNSANGTQCTVNTSGSKTVEAMFSIGGLACQARRSTGAGTSVICDGPEIRIDPTVLNFTLSGITTRRAEERVDSIQQDNSILLKGDTLLPEQLRRGTRSALGQRAKRHLLMQFVQTPTAEERQMLASAGVFLLDYIPDQTYWTIVPPSIDLDAIDLAALPIAGGITAAWIPLANDKMDATLGTIDGFPENARYDNGDVRVHASIFDDVSPAEAAQAVHQLGQGAQFLEWLGMNTMAVRLPLATIPALADLDVVQWVAAAPAPPEPDNATAAERINVTALRRISLPDPPPQHLTGNGVHVGVWEAPRNVPFNHTDFQDRLNVEDSVATVDEHATWVVGTLAGDGTGDIDARGMAPGVTVHAYGAYNDETHVWKDKADIIKAERFRNISISNHSYGDNIGWWLNRNGVWVDRKNQSLFGQYTADSGQWDAILRGIDVLSFWSAGNDRLDGRKQPGDPGCPNVTQTNLCDGPYDSISGSAASAKNTITIGATKDTLNTTRFLGATLDNNDWMTTFSSWGPTDDGRIKPDLCANGEQVWTTAERPLGSGTSGYDDHTADVPRGPISGTSFSSPSAAGAAALLWEYFRIRNVGANPAAYTMKALMIHGAKDIGPAGPDYQCGWGLVDALESKRLIEYNAFQMGTLTAGAFTGASAVAYSKEYDIAVVDTSKPLKATLVWADYKGAAGATRTLVSDLDLTVIAPDGTVYRPWVLDRANPATLATVGKTPSDRNAVDNVEQVIVNPANLSRGIWRARVYARNLPQGEQKYALVADCITGSNRCEETQAFTIHNDGNRDLSVSSITPLNTATWLTTSVPVSSIIIPAGGSRGVSVTVNYRALPVAVNTASLTISSNDADEAQSIVTVNASVPSTYRRAVRAAEPSDIDRDGVADAEDVFPLEPNEWTDADHDGIGDNADDDDDNDGIPDSYESTVVHLNPFNSNDATADSNGDGRTNLDEYTRGRLLKLGGAFAMDTNGNPAATQAEFLGGTSANNGVFLNFTTQQVSTLADVQAAIQVDPTDVGKSANLIMLLFVDASMFQLTAHGFEIWNGDITELAPYRTEAAIGNVVSLPIYTGQLPQASYQVFIAYQLQDGKLVYGSSPIEIKVQ